MVAASVRDVRAQNGGGGLRSHSLPQVSECPDIEFVRPPYHGNRTYYFGSAVPLSGRLNLVSHIW